MICDTSAWSASSGTSASTPWRANASWYTPDAAVPAVASRPTARRSSTRARAASTVVSMMDTNGTLIASSTCCVK